MNHFERIPWISSHPEYVKRGTFCSELSRVATLCSQYDDFVEACREVCDIYIARGYPPRLVATWLRNNYQQRWDAWLREDVRPSADVLVLKSEYNLSWDFFNVQMLAERMKAGWIEALRAMSFGGDKERRNVHDLPNEVTTTRYNGVLAQRLGRMRPYGGNVRADLLAESLGGFSGGRAGFLRLDKLGLLGKRLLVSKRKTTQLFDLVSLWRKVVLEQRDKRVLRDTQKPAQQATRVDFHPVVYPQLREESPERNIHRRTPSPERRYLGALMEAGRL